MANIRKEIHLNIYRTTGLLLRILTLEKKLIYVIKSSPALTNRSLYKKKSKIVGRATGISLSKVNSNFGNIPKKA
jgi:hypothetical protein